MNLEEGTKRKSGVIFHKIGIAEKDNDNGFKGWKLRTLSKFSCYRLYVYYYVGIDSFL